MLKTARYSMWRLPLLAAIKGFCSLAPKGGGDEKIVAAVLFERLPVVVPKTILWDFPLRFRWRQQHRREFIMEEERVIIKLIISPLHGLPKQIKVTTRSLQRALDRRLYLLIYGIANSSDGKPVWHLPEKIHDTEPTL